MGVNPINKWEPYLDNARANAILAVILSHTMSQIIYMRGDYHMYVWINHSYSRKV